MYIEKIKEVYDDKYSLYLSIDNCGERLGKYDIAADYYQKAKSVNDCLEIRKQISTLKKREFSYLLLKYY